MASIEQIMVSIGYFISVYVGAINAIVGLIGNIINILIFTQLKLFRRNEPALYLIVASIIDSCQLILPNINIVNASILDIDPTRTNLIWCKLRGYLINSTQIISVATVCFAAIDQYLSTSSNISLRQLVTYTMTQCVISIIMLFAFLYSIPFLMFYEIRIKFGCAIFNLIFNYSYSFVHYVIFFGTLPIVIASLFSLLAYRNVRQIVRRQTSVYRRRLDRQLTAMILVRVILLVTTTLPYTCFQIYEINKPVYRNPTCRMTVTEFIYVILNAIFNLDNSGSFILFFISSTRFRRQVKYFFHKYANCKCLLVRFRRGQVVPEVHLPIVEYPRPRISLQRPTSEFISNVNSHKTRQYSFNVNVQ